jgi:hypothetical protein
VYLKAANCFHLLDPLSINAFIEDFQFLFLHNHQFQCLIANEEEEDTRWPGILAGREVNHGNDK